MSADRAAPTWQGQVAAPTRLVLLRHGQTPLSVQRRYSGRGNPELTDLGRDQARAAAERIAAQTAPLGPIDAVVASPLARTVATAAAAADLLGIAPETHDGLIETDFGEWEGLTFAEASQRDPEVHRAWLGDEAVRPPGGESFEQVGRRVAATRAELLERYAGRTVLVVSHVTPIKTTVRQALGAGPEILFRMHLDLASICVTEFYPDGGSVVRLVNDTSHL